MSFAKRSVVVGGHRTSVSLETEFWQTLARMAAERGVSVNTLVTEIDRDRHATLSPETQAGDDQSRDSVPAPTSECGGLSSALRVAVLRWALAGGESQT